LSDFVKIVKRIENKLHAINSKLAALEDEEEELAAERRGFDDEVIF
jgi:hypothetical protein